MGLPLFPPGDDPGPNFAALIRHSDHYQYQGSAHHERWPAHEGIYEDLLDYAY